jgi:hypothetical protein
MASVFSEIRQILQLFLFMYFVRSSVAFNRASLCMRKFSISGAIRIARICKVGLKRFHCGEDALGVRFGGKPHPVGANARCSQERYIRNAKMESGDHGDNGEG